MTEPNHPGTRYLEKPTWLIAHESASARKRDGHSSSTLAKTIIHRARSAHDARRNGGVRATKSTGKGIRAGYEYNFSLILPSIASAPARKSDAGTTKVPISILSPYIARVKKS